MCTINETLQHANVEIHYCSALQEWGNKEDLVPGLEGGTWMYVQPNEAGTFPVRCAEYCGEMHSLMRGEVEVVAREEVGNCNENFGVYFDHGGEI